MEYISKRLFQPSSILGIISFVVTLVSTGGSLSPELVTQLAVSLGLVHINEAGK